LKRFIAHNVNRSDVPLLPVLGTVDATKYISEAI